MNEIASTVPVVLALSGSDPTGGAGIQPISKLWPATAAMRARDHRHHRAGHPDGQYAPLDTLIIEQARAVLEDMPVAAIKIGMLGSAEAVEAIHGLLQDYPKSRWCSIRSSPPVTARTGGDDVLEAIESLLLPHVTVLTPNSLEARALAPEADNLDACAMALLEKGCEFVLITGTHENTTAVTNTLYGNHRLLETYTWERLNGSFHGSGCTLAASIAGLLAQGLEPSPPCRGTALHLGNPGPRDASGHGPTIAEPVVLGAARRGIMKV